MTQRSPRPRTGRRRSDAAREAIIDAAATLMVEHGLRGVTIDAIAAQAGVGRQTIYRWWPSKGAVLSEAMHARAARAAPVATGGTPRADLRDFVAATFAGAREASAVLRAVAAEAQRDPHVTELFASFTAGRRDALRAMLTRLTADRPVGDQTLDLAVDQVFGVLWYRLLVQHAVLDDATARALADHVADQLTGGGLTT